VLLGEPRNLRIRGMETRLIKGHQIVHAENTTLMIHENHGIVEKVKRNPYLTLIL